MPNFDIIFPVTIRSSTGEHAKHDIHVNLYAADTIDAQLRLGDALMILCTKILEREHGIVGEDRMNFFDDEW